MTFQPEKDLTTQPEEDSISNKMDKHSHKRENSVVREFPQHQPLIQTMAKQASGALTAEKSPIIQPNV
jgi:protoheme ferro-lyase